MRFNLLGNRPGSWIAIVAVLAVFIGIESWIYRNADGEDLASSYVGSRLLIEGQAGHLFSYDPVSFAEIGEDDTWTYVAQRGGFYGYLHPYVQTPLWAYSLQPLCRHVKWPTFNRLFALLTMLMFAGTIWLVAKYWAPSFFNPYAIGLVAVALALSQPFGYAMYLNQTHMLFVFLTVAALLLAERDWPILAGFLLAYSASVKVTPALLIVYWLLTRRWKAAGSAVVWSVALWLLTLAAVGHGLVHVYLANLQRISRVLLVAGNNQSFAAWVMGRFYPDDAVFDIDILPLPALLRITSSLLMLVFTAWGGWLDWQRSQRAGSAVSVAPLGAMMAIVAATMFAPIAWTHYAIVLFLPLMLLAEANRALRAPWLWTLIGATLLLNYRPFATDIIRGTIGPLAVVRGQFFALALTLGGLAAVALLQARRRAAAPAAMKLDGALAA